jgi:hypothetical protein
MDDYSVEAWLAINDELYRLGARKAAFIRKLRNPDGSFSGGERLAEMPVRAPK